MKFKIRANQIHTAFIKTALHVKGVEVNITELTDGEQPVFVDDGNHIRGLCSILLYIDDRFPFPELFPGTPLRKSHIRTLVDDLIHQTDNPAMLANTLKDYEKRIKPDSYLLDSHQPCMIDVALAVLAPDTAKWAKFKALQIKPSEVLDFNEFDDDEADSLFVVRG